MKLMRYLIALAMALGSAQIQAESPQGRDLATTADLVELCKAQAGEAHYDAAMGFCLGYMDAVMDYHAALTEGPSYEPIACPDKMITRNQLKVVFLEWSGRNQALLDGERPVAGIMRAAEEKWPCQGL